MAYGFTAQANNATSATGTTQTVNFTVGASDKVIVVWAAYTGAATTLSFSDGTHTYTNTSAGGVVTSTLTHRMAMYYVLAPTPGSYTLTVTLGGTRANRRLAVATYTEIVAYQTAVSNGQTGAATTTDAVTTTNMTPSSQPALLTAVSFTANGTATYTQGTGHTSRGALSNWDSIGTFSSLMEDIRLTSTSAVPALFTIGTSRDTLSSGLVFTEPVAYTLTADAGSYALSGTAATLTRNYPLTAAGGTDALSGTDAGLLFNRVLSAAGGTYALSGLDATLTYTPAAGAYTLTADAGSYSLSGADAGLLLGRLLTVEASGGATYVLTGGDATLTYAQLERTLTAEAATYTYSGTDATLTWSGEQSGGKDDEPENRPGWIFDQYRSLQPKKVAALEKKDAPGIATGIAPASTPSQINALMVRPERQVPAIEKPRPAVNDDDEEEALMLLL